MAGMSVSDPWTPGVGVELPTTANGGGYTSSDPFSAAPPMQQPLGEGFAPGAPIGMPAMRAGAPASTAAPASAGRARYSATLVDAVNKAVAAHPGVPAELLLAVAGQESSGGRNNVGVTITNPNSAHYGAQALGPFQYMPKTWEERGHVGDPMNPYDAAMAAAQDFAASKAKHGGAVAEMLYDHYGRGKAPSGFPSKEAYALSTINRFEALMKQSAPSTGAPVIGVSPDGKRMAINGHVFDPTDRGDILSAQSAFNSAGGLPAGFTQVDASVYPALVSAASTPNAKASDILKQTWNSVVSSTVGAPLRAGAELLYAGMKNVGVPLTAPPMDVTQWAQFDPNKFSLGGQAALADSFQGDITAPSTWRVPTTGSGTAMFAAQALGSLASLLVPASLAAREITGARALAVNTGFGAAQTMGAGAEQVRANIAQMAQKMSPQQLYAEVPAYRQAVDEGKSHSEAINSISDTAANAAMLLSAPAGLAGGALLHAGAGALTGKLAIPGAANIANPALRRLTGGAIAGMGEGTQEATEAAAYNAGENVGLGLPATTNLGRNTFGDFVGGAMAGGPIGVAGAHYTPATVTPPNIPLPTSPTSPTSPIADIAAQPQLQQVETRTDLAPGEIYPGVFNVQPGQQLGRVPRSPQAVNTGPMVPVGLGQPNTAGMTLDMFPVPGRGVETAGWTAPAEAPFQLEGQQAERPPVRGAKRPMEQLPLDLPPVQEQTPMFPVLATVADIAAQLRQPVGTPGVEGQGLPPVGARNWANLMLEEKAKGTPLETWVSDVQGRADISEERGQRLADVYSQLISQGEQNGGQETGATTTAATTTAATTATTNPASASQSVSNGETTSTLPANSDNRGTRLKKGKPVSNNETPPDEPPPPAGGSPVARIAKQKAARGASVNPAKRAGRKTRAESVQQSDEGAQNASTIRSNEEPVRQGGEEGQSSVQRSADKGSEDIQRNQETGGTQVEQQTKEGTISKKPASTKRRTAHIKQVLQALLDDRTTSVETKRAAAAHLDILSDTTGLNKTREDQAANLGLAEGFLAKRKVQFSEAKVAEEQASSVSHLERTLTQAFLIPKRARNIVRIFATQADAVAAGAIPKVGFKVAGAHHNGKAVLIAENIQRGRELSIMLHEIGVHIGMDGLVGYDNMKWLAKQVEDWAGRNDGSVESTVAQQAKIRAEASHSENADKYMQELIAYTVEGLSASGVDPKGLGESEALTWVRKLWKAVRSALSALGMRTTAFTGQQLVDLAYGAAHMALSDEAAPPFLQKTDFGFAAGALNLYEVKNSPVKRASTAYDIKSAENGEPLGSLTLGLENGIPKTLYYIESADKRKGLGEEVLRALLAGNANGLQIVSMLPQAVEFWQKMGTIPKGVWDYGEGRLTEANLMAARGYQRGATKDTRLVEAARRAYANEQLNIGNETDALEEGVDFSEPVTIPKAEHWPGVLQVSRALADTSSEIPTKIADTVLRYIATLGNFVEVAKKYIPSAERYDAAVRRMVAESTSISNDMMPTAARWGALSDTDRNRLHAFITLTEQTGFRPDLAGGIEHMVNQHAITAKDENIARYENAAQAKARYREVDDAFKALSPEARTIYVEQANTTARVMGAALAAMESNLARTLHDPKLRKDAIGQIRAQYAIAAAGRPYIPHRWYGNYIVVGTDSKGGREVNSFTTQREARRVADALKQQGVTVRLLRAEEYFAHVGGTDRGFINSIQQAIDKEVTDRDLAKTLSDSIRQLYVSTLPEMSGAKRLMLRKNIPGWSQDYRRAWAEGVVNLSRYAAKINNLDDMRDAIEDAERSAGRNKAVYLVASWVPAGKRGGAPSGFSFEVFPTADARHAAIQAMGANRDFHIATVNPGDITEKARLIAHEHLPVQEAVSALEAAQPMFATAKDIAIPVAEDSIQATRYLNHLRARYSEFLSQKPAGPVSNAITNLGYLYYLGWTPRFALMNLTQVPILTAPRLAADYGAVKSITALNNAYSVIGKNRDVLARLAKNAFSKGGAATLNIGDFKGLSDGQRMLLKHLLDHGKLDFTQANELHAITGGTPEVLQRVIKSASWIAHPSEVMNRVVTALATYELEMAESGSQERAQRRATEVIDKSQFDYSPENRPLVLNHPTARVLFQFQQFAMQAMWQLGKAAYEALKGESPAVRRQQRAYLAYLMASTVAMAGVRGLPFMGAVMLALSLMGDDDDVEPEFALRHWGKQHLGETLGPMMTNGVLGGAGMDVSRNIGLGDIVPGTNAQIRPDISTKEKLKDFVFSAAGPTAALTGKFADASDAFTAGDTNKGFQLLLPKAFESGMKAYSLGTRGMTSANGVTRIGPDEFSAWDLALTAAGINAEKASYKQAEIGAELGAEHRLQIHAALLRKQFLFAQQYGTPEDIDQVRSRIAKYNDGLPMSLQITPRDLSHATQLQARAQRMAEETAGVATSRKQQDIVELLGLGD